MIGLDFEKMLAVYDEVIRLMQDRDLSDFQLCLLLQDAEGNIGVNLKNTEAMVLIGLAKKSRTDPEVARNRLVNPPT